MAAPGAARGTKVAAATLRRNRGVWALALGLMAACLVGCGSSVVAIPKGKPSPKPAMVTIAPGVRVPSSQVALPDYKVSSTHPLPSGVSAQQVVKDAEIDNLIENIAIERQDPALLAYADTGAWLAAERGEISHDKSAQITVLSIKDSVTSVEVGSKVDPQVPTVRVAVIITGSETRVATTATAGRAMTTKKFDALLWLQWDAKIQRFLICDTAAS
ncbi:MAG: hypothetical protein ACYCX9_09730 [Candidatus Dormibacteria bacterium]